jgi:uncharacterized membrane protein
MESHVKVAGHPLHPMLIVFPLGLLGTAVIFDIIQLLGGSNAFSEVSWYMIAAGVIGGLLAAPAGLVDWLAIPSGTRAKRIGVLHGLGNVVVLILFAVSWILRSGAPATPSALALVLSFAGLALALVTGWLGGELVDRLGVGVDDTANLDAPSSMSSAARM